MRPAPVALVRAGIAPRVDLGARFAPDHAIGDVRLGVLESERIDATATLGAGATWASTGHPDDEEGNLRHATVTVLAPGGVTIGMLSSAVVSPVFTVGATWSSITSDTTQRPLAPDGTFRRTTESRWAPRGTIGMRLRVSEAFALQPEVTWTRSPEGEPTVFLGLGFQFAVRR